MKAQFGSFFAWHIDQGTIGAYINGGVCKLLKMFKLVYELDEYKGCHIIFMSILVWRLQELSQWFLVDKKLHDLPHKHVALGKKGEIWKNWSRKYCSNTVVSYDSTYYL